MKEKTIDYSSFVPAYLQTSDKFYAIITDMVGSYAYTNKFFNKKFAFVADDFVGLPLEVAMHVDDNSECFKAVEKLFKSPDSVVPVRVRKPADNEGSFFWSDWEFSFVKNEKGEPIGVLCIGVDSSERELLEKDKEKISSDLDSLVQTMKDPFFSLDMNWRYTKVNSKLLEFYNCEEKDIIGKSYWSLFIESESNSLSEKLLKVMNEREVLNTEEYFPSLDKYINWVAYPSVGGMNVYLFDITEAKKLQKNQEDQRKELEKLLAENGAFMDIINQVAIVSKADLRGNITYVNDQFVEWSKYSKEELIGQNHRLLKSDEHNEHFFDNLWRTISTGNVFRGEIKNRAKDGTLYWVDTIIAPIFNSKKILKEYFAIRFVINDRKQSEQLLATQNQQLKDIAWQQSHELRRPLANIQGLVTLIEQEFKGVVDNELLANLVQSTYELDQTIHKITESINQ
jgi:PAS domain S-box-containing protein